FVGPLVGIGAGEREVEADGDRRARGLGREIADRLLARRVRPGFRYEMDRPGFANGQRAERCGRDERAFQDRAPRIRLVEPRLAVSHEFVLRTFLETGAGL